MKTVQIKNGEIEQLKSRLVNTEEEFRLENKYSNVLLFIQFLDRCVDDLPEYAKDFKTVIHKKLVGLLETYGYQFIDFDKGHTELYDCDEMFLCGSAMGITPIVCIDGHVKLNSDIGNRINVLYNETVRGRRLEFIKWNIKI